MDLAEWPQVVLQLQGRCYVRMTRRRSTGPQCVRITTPSSAQPLEQSFGHGVWHGKQLHAWLLVEIRGIGRSRHRVTMVAP